MVDSIKKTLALIALLIGIMIFFVNPHLLHGQGQMQGDNPLAKWRSAHDPAGNHFVGRNACAQCHAKEVASQPATSMGHALELVADCQILSTRPKLTFRNGPFTYQITREGKRSIYAVSDGVNTIAEPILYCFGQGKVGQTYTFRHNGALYETRVSYFQEIQNLDFTIGHPRTVPTSLDEALGRPIGRDEAQSCFGCHSTAAVNGSQLQLDQLIPGVSCEACHGPGENHVASMRSKNFDNSQIFNPMKLNANDLTQSFCGSCHISFEQAMLMPGQAGINNIRFQPYRIFNSPGHNKNDLRISCIACHNPHEKLERDVVSYDSKCLACHLTDSKSVKTETRTALACPVSSQRCVTCHMPKVELPGMHTKFTDHWIRVVKPNDPIPN